jgi:hypothetical protein
MGMCTAWYSKVVFPSYENVGLVDILLDEIQQISLWHVVNPRVDDWHLQDSERRGQGEDALEKKGGPKNINYFCVLILEKNLLVANF